MGPPRGGMSNPYANASNFGSPGVNRTAFGAGRTPNPYADGGKTPAWNPSRTPNASGDGGKTPAWSVSSKTPNPYAEGGRTPAFGGRTPAWHPSGSKTPNPYTSGGNTWGDAGRDTAWGSTPARPSGSSSSEWGQEDWPVQSRPLDSTWVSIFGSCRLAD